MTVSMVEDKWHTDPFGQRAFGIVNNNSFNERQDTEYKVYMSGDYRKKYPHIEIKGGDYSYRLHVYINRVSAWKLFQAIAADPETCEIVKDLCESAIEWRKEKAKELEHEES